MKTPYFQSWSVPACTSGRKVLARRLTWAGLAILVLLAGWSLHQYRKGRPGAFTVPRLVAAVGLWVAYRVVNIPKFADFLMRSSSNGKVSWPSAQADSGSIVVLVTVAVLATLLFVYALIWSWVLRDLLNILGTQPTPPDAPPN